MDFRQQFQIAADGVAEEIRQRHIAAAREKLADALKQRPIRPAVLQIVDGRENASLNDVKFPGVILFRLGVLQEVGLAALALAQKLSPVASGRYRSSWAVLVDGKPREIGAGTPPIGPDSRVVIVNPQPYARKIQGKGARLVGIPPGIIERVANAVRAAYPTSLRVSVAYVDVSGFAEMRRARRGTKPTNMRFPAVSIRQIRSFD
jgi:hypothetical protein